MINWISVALIAGLFSNLSNFMFRIILKKGDDATAYAWFHGLSRVIIYGLISIYDFRITNDPKGLLLLLGLGIVEIISSYTVMKMHSFSTLSISTIISRARLIWVPIIAFIMFREILNIYEYLGIFILFLGLSTVSSPKKIFTDNGVKWAYISSISTAMFSIFIKIASPYASIPVLMVASSIPPVIFLPLLMKQGGTRVINIFKTNLLLKIGTALVNAFSMFLLTLAITLGPVGSVTALHQGMMITSVVAGIIFLKERDNLSKKIIGSVISLVGIFLLTFKI